MNPATRIGLLCLTSAVFLTACGSAPEPQEVVRPVLAVQPQVSASRFDSFAGEIHARFEPTLAFRVGGTVMTRLVDSGDRVSAGQVLATLDPSDLRLQAEASEAQFAAAEADVALARAEQARYANLLQRQLISASQYDQVNTRLQAAEAQLEAARAQRSVSANQAAYSELRAPADGVIAKRMVEAGQVVSAGQAAFVLAQDGEREVAISIPERDAARHAVGQLVRVVLWSQPQQPLNGKIREMAPSADTASRTFAARIQIDGDDTAGRTGRQRAGVHRHRRRHAARAAAVGHQCRCRRGLRLGDSPRECRIAEEPGDFGTVWRNRGAGAERGEYDGLGRGRWCPLAA